MKILIALLITFFVCAATISAQTTVFTYQGKLTESGMSPTANYDMQFRLFDNPTVGQGTQQGLTFMNSSVPATNGIFTVQLDFGSAVFATGADLYLEISVRPASSTSAYTSLAPRQKITSAPYAIKSKSADTAANADNAANTAQLGGVPAGEYVTTASGGNTFIRNATTTQNGANFNISGTGAANIFNAQTQYNIGDFRVLSIPGQSNLYVGVFAGKNQTTGGYNVFVGNKAGENNNSGFSNSFVGVSAGLVNSSGFNNSIFGADAGQSNTAGYENSFIGSLAGNLNTIGYRNTLIGSGADVTVNNLFNATAVGYLARVSQSNSLVLGNSNVNVGIGTSAPVYKLEVFDASNNGFRVQTNILGGRVASFGGFGDFQVDAPGIPGGRFTILENGNVGIGVNNPGSKLSVNGIISVGILGASSGDKALCHNNSNQIAFCASSSIRYKQNISAFDSGLSLIKQLRPVSFNWRTDNRADFGFIAEEVNQVEPLLAVRNEKGEVEGVRYDRMSVVFVNAFKEQQVQIQQQQNLIKKQQTEIEGLKQLVCLDHPTAKICREEAK